jgi:hypothetical protein
MTTKKPTRSEFLRDGSSLAAGAILVNIAAPGGEPCRELTVGNGSKVAPRPGTPLSEFSLTEGRHGRTKV